MRKVPTASGATAVQIAEKVRGKREIVDHIGSVHTPAELAALVAIAKQRIQSDQEALDLGFEESRFPGPEAGEGESTNSGESNGAPLDRGRI